MEYKPLFGTIAYTGKTFTLHYHKQGNLGAINKTGYDKSVFDECPKNIPIVRFDLGSLKNVLESIRGEVDEIEEYYNLGPWSKPISLSAYLDKMISYNIPIDYT